jgi:hypothetical protein
VMPVLESRSLNENSRAEKILAGLFNVQNDRHTDGRPRKFIYL